MMTASQALHEMRNQRPEDTAQAKHAPPPKLPGEPGCVHCLGLGYVRFDLPITHKFFGKIFLCDCVPTNGQDKPPL